MSTGSRAPEPPFNAAELTMLAHLYRGEMYRSKVWRTRLDATTNWAVVTTGVAISVTFSSAENSPLPLVLVVLLDLVFLAIEARRYRYFDIWRTRVRMMETSMYGPLLRLKGVRIDDGWNEALALDYEHLHFHISFWEAMGRRLRRNYSFLFLIQGVSYAAKICIHPTPVTVARPTVGARGDRSDSWRDRVNHRISFPRRIDRAGASHPQRAARSWACETARSLPVTAGLSSEPITVSPCEPSHDRRPQETRCESTVPSPTTIDRSLAKCQETMTDPFMIPPRAMPPYILCR